MAKVLSSLMLGCVSRGESRALARHFAFAKVTRSALQNAASVAAMVLTTEALVTDIPEEKKDMPAMPPGGMGDY